MAARQSLRDLLGASRPVASPISVAQGGGAPQVDTSVERSLDRLGRSLGPALERQYALNEDRRMEQARTLAETNPELGRELLQAKTESQQRAVLRAATKRGLLDRSLEPYARVAFEEAEGRRRVYQMRDALENAVVRDRRTSWRRDEDGRAVPGEAFADLFDELAGQIGGPGGRVGDAVWASGLRDLRNQYAHRSTQVANAAHEAIQVEDFENALSSSVYALAGSFDDPVAFVSTSMAFLESLDEMGRKGQIDGFKRVAGGVLSRFARQFGSANPERARLTLQVISNLEIDGRRLGDGAKEPELAGVLYEEIERLDRDDRTLRDKQNALAEAAIDLRIAAAADPSGFDAWFAQAGLPADWRNHMQNEWDRARADMEQAPSAAQTRNLNEATLRLVRAGTVEEVRQAWSDAARLDMHPTQLVRLEETFRGLSSSLQSVQSDPLWRQYRQLEDLVLLGELESEVGEDFMGPVRALRPRSANEFVRDGVVDRAAIEQATAEYNRVVGEARRGYRTYERDKVQELLDNMVGHSDTEVLEAGVGAGLTKQGLDRLVAKHQTRADVALTARQTANSLSGAWSPLAAEDPGMEAFVEAAVQEGEQMGLRGEPRIMIQRLVSGRVLEEVRRRQRIQGAVDLTGSGLANGLEEPPEAFEGTTNEDHFAALRGHVPAGTPKKRRAIMQAMVLGGYDVSPGSNLGGGPLLPASRSGGPAEEPGRALAGAGLLTIRDLQAGEITVSSKGGQVVDFGGLWSGQTTTYVARPVNATVKLDLSKLPPLQTPAGFTSGDQLDAWLRKEDNRQFLVDWATKAGELSEDATDEIQAAYAKRWARAQTAVMAHTRRLHE